MPHQPARYVIYFLCPSCLHAVRAALGVAGRRVACPACSDPLTVPTVGEAGDGDTLIDHPAPPAGR